jgi:putative MFS transporter
MASNALDDAPLSRFHKKLAVFSAGGPFLDGYVLSIIGVAMVQITDQWKLSATAQGLIGASSLIGILLGSFAGGWLTDRFGRDKLFTLDLIAIVAFSIAQFFVPNVAWLVVLRLLIGVVVGADYPIATSLMAEFAPRKQRGPLLGAFVTAWFVGAAAAYIVGQGLLLLGEDGWRWMLASAAVPGAIIVLARIGTPESPRWLLSRGEIDKANAVLQKVYGPDVTVADLPPDVDTDLGVKAFFRAGYGGRMAFVSAFWTCSIIPLFAVYAFAPAILEALNIEESMAHIGSAVITVMFIVGCVIALGLVNRIGRRALVIQSFIWSGVPLLLMGLFPTAATPVIMALFMSYAVFIGGTQILQYVYPTELFPTELRGSAVGLGHSISRIGAATGTFLVPLSLNSLGIGTTMLIAAGITLIGAVIAVLWAPETRGMCLTESAALDDRRQPVAAPAAARAT